MAKTKEELLAYQRAWAKANRDKVRGYQRTRYLKNPDKDWARSLRKKYNLTTTEWAAMNQKQEGGCGICGVVEQTRLSVDHCHATGEVRGLLCRKCNKFLWVLDNPGWLEKAQQYLTKG